MKRIMTSIIILFLSLVSFAIPVYAYEYYLCQQTKSVQLQKNYAYEANAAPTYWYKCGTSRPLLQDFIDEDQDHCYVVDPPHFYVYSLDYNDEWDFSTEYRYEKQALDETWHCDKKIAQKCEELDKQESCYLFLDSCKYTSDYKCVAKNTTTVKKTTIPVVTNASDNMSEMLDICESSGPLQIIYIAKSIFTFVCYMVPLLLAIMLSIDISRVVTDPKEVKKVLDISKKRIIIGLILVFTPTIVNILIGSLGGESALNKCYENANPEHIKDRKEYEQKYFDSKKPKVSRNTTKKTATTTKSTKLTGFNVKEFTSSTNNKISYIINVPSNATSGKPLIIFLHGDLGSNDTSAITNLENVQYVKNDYDNEYPFVYLVPITVGTSWYHNSDTQNTLKELFNYVINEYNIDKDRVIITGHSRGAVGLWYVVGLNPNMFSVAVPLSCGYASPPPVMSSFKGVYVCAKIESSGQRCSESELRDIVSEVNGKGGRGYFEKVTGYNHGSILGVLKNKEFYLWMMHPDGICPNFNK